MSHQIKIYSDKSYLPAQTAHVILLYPFWGINPESLESYPSAYERYAQIGSEFFEMTSYEDADYIVAPVAWEKNEAGRELILQMGELATPQKPIVVFFWHDSDEAVDVPNSIIFRTSFYKSTQKSNEYAMPAWSEDFIQTRYDGRLALRDKQESPTIGFCGYAMTKQSRIIQGIKDIGRYLKDGVQKTRIKQGKRRYHVMRGDILRMLSKSHLVKTNFIIRDQFHGQVSATERAKHQQEYVDNLIHSDYVLCMRGAGNFSYRLYETLACGRIPVFVNTDCVLPYDFVADWKQYCVWIEEHEIGQIADKVNLFHDQLSPEEFIELQKKCRAFWEDYLSPHGFFANFHRHFE